MMIGRFGLLIIAILAGVVFAIVMLCVKDTAFGGFLKDKMNIIILIFAVIIVGAFELGRRKER